MSRPQVDPERALACVTMLHPRSAGRLEVSSGHLVWSGAVNSSGHPRMMVRGTNLTVAFLVWRACGLRLPARERVQFKYLCGVSGCVLPGHAMVTPWPPVTATSRKGKGGPRRERCKHGHDLSLPMAVYTAPGTGWHECRVCRAARVKRRSQGA